MELGTKAKNTWCPGCPNFMILAAFKDVVKEMVEAGEMKLENLTVGSGIGCHGKISDYLNVNTFNGLHGRIIPLLTGIKVANPDLQVVGFCGDGDAFAEGIEHVIHAAKRNSDITVFVHNNQVFALTTGQVTPTSAKGQKGRTTPAGNPEEPINPLFLLLSAGATFVARTYALQMPQTKEIMKKAMRHHGFAVVEIIQPCITFDDTREFFNSRLAPLPADYDNKNFDTALAKVREQSGQIPIGVFYEASRPTYEEQV